MENNKLSEMMQSTMSSIKDLVEVNNGGGSAAAVKIEPIGFLVVKDDGVRMINVAPPAKNGVDRIIDMMPDVMDKIESIANTNKKTD